MQRVLIVDDHEGFRSAARALLEHDGFVVVGQAADGDAAVAAIRALNPDVVLLDVHLPDADGFELSRAITARHDSPAVVITSGRPPESVRVRLAASGARGFIPKADLEPGALAAALAGG